MIHLSHDIENLARRLAEVQSVSIEEAIRQALEDRARSAGILPLRPRSRDASPEAVAARIARFDAFARDVAAMPVNDPRSVGQIIDDLNVL